MAAPKDNGLVANVNDPMAAGGMTATDVTQASEQAKSREFFDETSVQGAGRRLPRDQHGEGRVEACGREGCGGEASPGQER